MSAGGGSANTGGGSANEPGLPPSPALVLSGSIGHGHDSVAYACAAALSDAGPVDVLDCMKLLGRSGGRLGAGIFRRLLAVAPLYDAFHFSALRGGGALGDQIADLSARKLFAPLAAEIDRRRAELVVSVFATGVGALARVRARLPRLRAVVLLTDATAHRVWVEEGIDRYLVCSEMAAGSVRQYLPDADIVVVPPPVRAAFFDAPPRDDARRQLGLGPGGPTVLVMAGAWGSGPLESVARAMTAAGIETVVVTGHDRAARERLRRLDRRDPGSSAGASGASGGSSGPSGPPDLAELRVVGFSDQMPALLAACDVVVTSPGQTCHEARVVGRPLVVLDSVPGHGRENLLAELTRPGAIATRPRPDAVLAAVRSALAGGGGIAEPWPVKSAEEWGELFRVALGRPASD